MNVVDLALSDDDEIAQARGVPSAPQSAQTFQSRPTDSNGETQIDLTRDLVQDITSSDHPVGAKRSATRSPRQASDANKSRAGDSRVGPLLVDDQVDFTASVRCPSCSRDDVFQIHMFTLDRCGHSLCPLCMVAKIASSRDNTSVCPVASCGHSVAVRDLALILHEDAWSALQARRLVAFRARRNDGVRCPSCVAWIEGTSIAPRGAGRGGRRGKQAGGGSSAGSRTADVAEGSGSALARARALLAPAPLVCGTCNSLACRFCGAKLKRSHAAPCNCGESKLWSASGLLTLLDELVDNPRDVNLTGPTQSSGGSSAGQSTGGRGTGVRGRGKGTFSSGVSGKGRGRAKGGVWSAMSLGGFGSGHGDMYGGSNGGISAKWTKGTGYGGAGDTAAAKAAKAAAAGAEERADRAMVVVFDALTSRLPTRGEYPEHVPELLALLRESSLLQAVCAYLRNDSLMDIAKRRELYQSIFKLVTAFAVHELLAPLIDNVPPKRVEHVASDHIAGVQADESGSSAGKGKGKARAPCGDSVGAAGVPAADAASDSEVEVQEIVLGEQARPFEGSEVEDEVSVADLLASANRQARVFTQAPGTDGKKGDAGALKFAIEVTEVHDRVKASLTYLRGLAEARASSAAVKAVTSAMGTGGVAGAGLGRKRKREQLECVEVSLTSRYVDELGESRFEVIPLLGTTRSHHFASQAAKQGGGIGGRARAVRISQEVSSLATSLPVQPDSSIFLRVDEDRFDVMRALITGPKDTPYECGCFEFDILLPPDYPNRPPQVHFLTTGGGRVRFNPNLYNTGKVCLSLLGTWSGPGWDAKASTLLQVLVSIQSLIFVAEPYFNEPGFEGQLGTSQGRARSWSYNARVRNATLKFGVVGALEARSSPMYHIVRKHFRLMKGQITRTARAWLMEAGGAGRSMASAHVGGPDGGCGGDYASMSTVVARVEELLSTL